MMDFRALVTFYARALWRRRWAVLSVVWVICIVGWVSIVALPDEYTAKARVQVDADRPLAPLLRDIIGETDPDQQMIAMRADLLSKPAMQSVVRRAGILGPAATETDVQATAIDTARHVRLLVKDRNIFDISYEDTDPWRAQRVMESIVDTLVDRNIAAARRETEQALRFIDTQIRGYEDRLRDAEARLAEFRRQHGGELGTSQGYARRLEELTAEEQQFEAEQKAKLWQRDRIRAELHRTPEWLTEQQLASPGGGMMAPQENLERLRQRYAELSKLYTDRHPDVAVLKAQIIDAEDRLATEPAVKPRVAALGTRRLPNPTHQRLQQDLLNVEAQIVTAQLQSGAVASSIQSLRETSSQLPDIEAQIAQLDRDYSVVRASYAKLIERREAILLAQKMAGEKTAVVFRTVEKPQTPNVPSGPNRPLFFTALTAAGIAVGLGYALVKVFLAGEAPRTPEGLRTITGRPVIGVISMVRQLQPWRTATSLVVFAVGWLTLVATFGGLVYVYQYQLTQFQPSFANLMQPGWFITQRFF